jgi:hypothetical protein
VNNVETTNNILLLQPASSPIEKGESVDGKAVRKISAVKKQLGLHSESSVSLIESKDNVVIVDTWFRNEVDAHHPLLRASLPELQEIQTGRIHLEERSCTGHFTKQKRDTWVKRHDG